MKKGRVVVGRERRYTHPGTPGFPFVALISWSRSKGTAASFGSIQFCDALGAGRDICHLQPRCKDCSAMNTIAVTRQFLRTNPLPSHEESSDKQARGRVLVIAGSVEVPGASLLAGLGALRAGAGILQIATCRSGAPHLGMAMPEAMVVGCRETGAGGIDPAEAARLAELGSGCDAVLVGPGMMDETAVAELPNELLKRLDAPVFVLDASAFATLKLSELRRKRAGGVVVTPHSGEMAKFLGIPRDEVDKVPLQAARQASSALQAVVALKGQRPISFRLTVKLGSARTVPLVWRPRVREIRLLAYSPDCRN